MSLPLHRTVRGSSARTTRTENGFWGLDLTSNAFDRPFSRAVDTENLIWEGAGLRARPGYSLKKTCIGRINGIFFYGDRLIVHAGTRLYEQDSAFENPPHQIYIGLKDAPSHAVLHNQTVIRRICRGKLLDGWRRETLSGDLLLISDGEHFLFYDGLRIASVVDAYWGETLNQMVVAEDMPVFYGTVPFTAVAKLPDSGVADIDPKGDNRLTQFRCESFYLDSSKDVTDYVLSCPTTAYNAVVPPELQIRDRDGIWRTFNIHVGFTVGSRGELTKLTLPALRGGMAFNYNPSDGEITGLGSGNGVIANDGMDNVRITYAVNKDYPEALTGATVMGLYGPDGADNVLFLGGSAAAPGEDAFSAEDDFFCFYETSRERLGSSSAPVTGYCRLSDGRLAVLKNERSGPAVFFRSHNTVTFGATMSGEPYQVDVYPSRAGAAVAGCLSSQTVGTAGNEPCFLTENGVYSVRSVSNELTNLNETVLRSEPINPLLMTLDPSAARSVSWRGRYLLTFGDCALITDGERDSSGAYRFLKWRFSTFITALGVWAGQLYLGDAEGNLYLFGDSGEDAGVPFRSYWQTPLLEDSTGRRILLRGANAAATPDYKAAFGAELLQDGCPAPVRIIPAGRPDFSDWDFGQVALDGRREPVWFPLLRSSAVARSFSLRLTLPGRDGFVLWGLRMIYERGGKMK